MYQDLGETILRLSDKSDIPKDEGNRDYREYLDWLAQGNAPLVDNRVVDQQNI